MNHRQVSFRCFQPHDISEILRIQNENLLSNLTETERADGYLSVAFSGQQFKEMNDEIPIVVAELGFGLGGYMCSSSLAYNTRIPLLAHMIGLFSKTIYGGRPLDTYRSFVYGPVCIERTLRGTGLLNGMFDALTGQLAGRFDLGTLFISRGNPRSLNAHVHQLGMQLLKKFTFEGNEFYLLVFDVPERLESSEYIASRRGKSSDR
jgi:hypothetical protein